MSEKCHTSSLAFDYVEKCHTSSLVFDYVGKCHTGSLVFNYVEECQTSSLVLDYVGKVKMPHQVVLFLIMLERSSKFIATNEARKIHVCNVNLSRRLINRID